MHLRGIGMAAIPKLTEGPKKHMTKRTVLYLLYPKSVHYNVQRFGNRFGGGEGATPYKATFLYLF